MEGNVFSSIWMVIKRFLWMASLFLLMVGCYNYVILDKGGYAPKRIKYEFQDNPYQLKKEDPIKTNVVYVTIDTFKYGKKNKYQDLHFYKFYENGRYHKGFIDAFKENSAADFNDLFLLGYYRIFNDNIDMEYFFINLKERGDMRIEKAYIKNDTLFFPTNYRTKSGKYHLRYVPRRYEGLRQNTHW
ncbi:MAG: hypothetical protein OIF50_09120 [Flavobacteriaceae bacterium]|nr:hypothetical protein [Flavobacteriaceae bacterium]